jgi:hypothetical protein
LARELKAEEKDDDERPKRCGKEGGGNIASHLFFCLNPIVISKRSGVTN